MKNEKFTNYYPEPEYPVETFCMQLSKKFMVSGHWHEDLEIVLVDSGVVSIKMEDDCLVLRAGEGIFFNQNQLHFISSASKEAAAIYTINFHPSFLFGLESSYLGNKYLTPLLVSPHCRYLLLNDQTDENKELLNLAQKIITLDQEKAYAYELEVLSLLLSFWKKLLPNAAVHESNADRPRFTSSVNKRILEATRFIEEHYAEQLSLEDIADSIHLSKSECCRCFKRTLGTTPFEYLTNYRIYAAMRKMQQMDGKDENISDLAASVGFNSPSYFNKVFKKYSNCTPMEYKRSL